MAIDASVKTVDEIILCSEHGGKYDCGKQDRKDGFVHYSGFISCKDIHFIPLQAFFSYIYIECTKTGSP